MSRGIFLVAALALTACPSGNKCVTNADCKGGEVCSVMSGTCVTGTGMGGGIGGGGIGGGVGAGGGSGGGGGTGGSGGGTTGGGGGGDGGTQMNNGGDTCEMATTITAGTITGSTVGGVNSYDPGCTGDVTPGPDSVYKITVPAGQRLTATATPETATMGNQYDLAVYLIEGPASNCDADAGITCVSASDDPDALETPETAGYFNATSNPVDIFIVVDSYFDAMHDSADGGIGASNEGNFTLTTTIAAPAAGDRCDTAQPLTAGTPLTGQDMANYGDDYTSNSTGCRGSTAADATYSITVAAGQLLSVTVTPDMNFDATLSITDGAAACGTTCIAGVDVGDVGQPDTINYKNTTGAAQTIFVIVDGYFGSTGTFSLAATLTTPPADDACNAPTALTAGTPLTAQAITGYSNDYSSGTGCGFTSGVDRVYSINVPDGQRVVVTATPTSTANPSLSLVDGAANCGMTCLANATSAGAGAVETLSFTNRSGAAQNYIVVVDFSSTSTGTFDIVANVATPPADDVCQAPTALTAGTPAQGSTTTYTNDYSSTTGAIGCTTTGVGGNDRVYSISIPSMQRGLLTVTPTPDAGFNPSINLVEGAASVCAAMPRTCAAGSNVATANNKEVVAVYNTTGAARTFFAIVDSTSGGGDFTIGYTNGVPAANDTCTTNNVTLTAGTLAAQNLTGFENDYAYGTGCFPFGGPDRVYKVTLAANQRYSGTVTPTADAGMDTVLSLIPGPAANCEATPRTCTGGADDTFRNEAETVNFSNNTSASRDFFVVVGDYYGDTTNRDFSIVSTIDTAMVGDTCNLPRVTTAGMVTGETTMNAGADVVFAPTAMGCAPTSSFTDRVYSVSVPAGQTLTVTGTPANMVDDLMINIIDSPATTCDNVTMCLASADDGLDGDPETATYMNSTGAAKVVFVQVAGYGSTNASYSLNVQIQ